MDESNQENKERNVECCLFIYKHELWETIQTLIMNQLFSVYIPSSSYVKLTASYFQLSANVGLNHFGVAQLRWDSSSYLQVQQMFTDVGGSGGGAADLWLSVTPLRSPSHLDNSRD